MSWRRLRVILQHLPPESHTMTALRNALTPEELAAQADTGQPERAPWSQMEQLTATLVDAVRRVEYVLRCAHTEKGSTPPTPPEPMRRPGAAPIAPSTQLTDEGAAFLFDLINGGVS